MDGKSPFRLLTDAADLAPTCRKITKDRRSISTAFSPGRGLPWIDDAWKELDALERPFCAFDRRYFGHPVSRDTYIDGVRRRYSTNAARISPRAELPT